MKKALLSVLVVVLMLTMIAPSNSMAGSPQSLADSQMGQITGGEVASCSFAGNIGYCCIDLWIFKLCLVIDFGSL